jgi:hypothetical protein
LFRAWATRTQSGGLTRFFELVQDNGQAFCEVAEVPIHSKDGQVTSDGDGTNQEVGVRALNAIGSTQVEKLRSGYKIFA